jgi:hypothetical protein
MFDPFPGRQQYPSTYLPNTAGSCSQMRIVVTWIVSRFDISRDFNAEISVWVDFAHSRGGQAIRLDTGITERPFDVLASRSPG